MWIYDSNWELISDSYGSSRFDILPVSTGTYYIRVGGSEDSASAYSLNVSAENIQLTDIALGAAHNATLQSGVDQFYRVTVPSGGVRRFAAYTENRHGTGIRLYDAGWKQIASDTYTSNRNASVNMLPLSAGTYYIRISGYNASVAGDYSLTASADLIQFTDIAPGTAHNATLQSGVDQFYRVTVPSGGVRRLIASTGNRPGTQIVVYDAGWKQIDSDTYTPNRNASVNILPVSAGTYYIRVSGYNASVAGAYSLTASIDVIQFTDITLGTAQNATLQSGVDQFYRVTVPSGGLKQFTACTENRTGTQMWVYDTDWKQITSDTYTSSRNASVNILPVSAGTYYIRVGGSGNTAGAYSLTASTDIVQSTDIAPGTARNATLQSGVAQFYRVTVPAGNAKRLIAYTNRYGWETQICIYDSNGKLIAADNYSGHSTVNIPVSAGTYYIRVSDSDGYQDGAGPYSLYVSTQ
jgi:uncharacterized protein YneR